MSFTTLAPTDFVVSSDSITAPAWSTNAPTLTQFYTASAVSSTSITANAFYLNVYQLPTSSVGSAVQFSIAYGNALGSGSMAYNQLVPGVSPSLTTYKQYKTLVYGPEVSGSYGFNFGGANSNSQDIWVINIDRNMYKESLFPGTFNLSLSGSGGQIQLCDNSNDVTTVTYLDCGRVYDIVSGSYGHASNTTSLSQIANGYTVSGSYGLFLPDIGCIILNPAALSLASNFGGIGLSIDLTSSTSAGSSYLTSSINNNTLFTAISQSAAGTGIGFQLNSQETVSSNYVFVRLNNAEYNYTSNPTFVSGSGDLLYPTLINSPQTFVTTVGLYNDNHELLAVAKMSRPLIKDFTKEALLTVKLDW